MKEALSSCMKRPRLIYEKTNITGEKWQEKKEMDEFVFLPFELTIIY